MENIMIKAILLISLCLMVSGKYFSQLRRNIEIKYHQSFTASSWLHCGGTSNGQYFYYENNTCYIGQYPSSIEGSKYVKGLYFADDDLMLQAREKCLDQGQDAHILESEDVCVKFINREAEWSRAKQHCEEMGWNLMQMKNGLETIENLKRLNLIHDISKSFVWIGGTDIEHEQDWKWLDDTNIELSDQSWSEGQGTASVSQNCLAISTNISSMYRWFDKKCIRTLSFLCETPLPDLLVDSQELLL